MNGNTQTCSFTTRKDGQRWWQVRVLYWYLLIVALHVSLPQQPRVGSVLVSLAQGQQQNFAVFLVSLREGNTAEYKPCDAFTGVSGEEMVEIECDGERVGFGVSLV